jgi:hypothetical protein
MEKGLSNIEWNKRLAEKWGDVTFEDLRDQIIGHGLPIDLKESVHVKTEDVTDSRIELVVTYLAFGAMIDMGVGRGNPIGFPGKRRPVKWYNKSMTRHANRLALLYMRRYGHLASLRIVESLPDVIKIG